MKTQLYIPKKINVGYQERGGTYTGKLAYIIYWDDKGKLRKETSWQNWRDKKIDNSEIENVPTEGFVLNKGVGGQRESWGWNARNEYIRVYDPRGFEFEISVANLLFILQECTSTKGKGLEGEFIYSWEGKELVLLPVDSFEYRESTKFTNLQATKVTRKDMVPGCAYTCKKGQELLYLGRFPYYDMQYSRKRGDYSYRLYNEKLHVFLNTNYVDDGDEYSVEKKYITHKGFTKLAVRNTETPVENYADLLEDYHNSAWGSEPKRFKHTRKDVTLKPIDEKNPSNYNTTFKFYLGDDENTQRYNVSEKWDYGRYNYRTGHRPEPKFEGYRVEPDYGYKFYDGELVREYGSESIKPHNLRGVLTKEEVLALDAYICEVELEGGKLIKIEDY